MSIKIPVQADFDSASVEQQLQQFQQKLNALGQQIAQANKTQFNPISSTTLQDLQRITKQFEALRRVSGDLNKRINATGQKGRGFLDLDWNQLYPDASSRARQMAKAFQYVTGQAFLPGSGPGGAGPGRTGPGGGRYDGSSRNPWVQTGANAVQAGLRGLNGLTGGAGGVAAGALNTGMSAGFGAGMMGLLGGIVALGVSKAVGAVAEHVGKAEKNNIDLDRLKRTLGDVGVSFEQLKASVHGSADQLGITFDEAGKLAQQFAKLSNISGEGATREIPGELATSVGMARSFGLDPSQTTSVLGQMRGLGVTRNKEETRRFALLIGETIGKSGAFSKADEVMEAIGNYATTQTRNSMGGANVSGYAGLFAGMVGSGIPGLDPTGAGSMLARMNAALSGGGAKGEASQFFTGMVGQSLGLNSLQTQVLREGGMFATTGKMFGDGSAYARYMGKTLPGGDTTFYEATRAQLEKQRFDSDPEQDKLLRAMAFGNHTGLNMNQAMAMLSISPKAMGAMSRFGNTAEFNASGISGIATALEGTAAQRQSLAGEMLSRTGKGKLSKEDAEALTSAMSEDNDKFKNLLASLSAKYGQEETTGSVARDSKALLENIKTSIADKLVPYMNDVREGILYMAGDRKKTGADVLKEIAEKGSEYRTKQLSAPFDKKLEELSKLRGDYASSKREHDIIAFLSPGGAAGQRSAKSSQEIAKLIEEVDKQVALILEEKRKAIEEEAKRLEREKSAIETSAKAQNQIADAVQGSSLPAQPGKAPAMPGDLAAKMAAEEKRAGLPPGTLAAIVAQETGGRTAEFLADPSKYHYGLDASGRRIAPHTGRVSTAFGPFGILESTARDPGYGVSPLKDKGLDEQMRFTADYLAARSRAAGSLRGGLAGYGEGSGYASRVVSRIPLQSTPMPDDASAARRAGDQQQLAIRGNFEPAVITLQYPDGRPAALPATLSPHFRRATPFGQPG